MERTVTGEIQKWSDVKPGYKKDNTPYARISCKIDDEWHGFFAPTPKDLNRMIENFPEGFNVTFIEWKGKEDDKYWNYKKATMKAFDGTVPVEHVQSSLNDSQESKKEPVLDTKTVEGSLYPLEKVKAEYMLKTDHNPDMRCWTGMLGLYIAMNFPDHPEVKKAKEVWND